jgi:hypothetical protein
LPSRGFAARRRRDALGYCGRAETGASSLRS